MEALPKAIEMVNFEWHVINYEVNTINVLMKFHFHPRKVDTYCGMLHRLPQFWCQVIKLSKLNDFRFNKLNKIWSRFISGVFQLQIIIY